MASIELQRTETLCSDYHGSDAKGDEKLKDDTVGWFNRARVTYS